MQLAYLIYNHPKGITVRFTSWTTIRTEVCRIQQLRAHPTNSPSRRNHRFGQEGRAQISHGHEARIGNTSSARFVNKDVCLSRLSVGQNVPREIRTYPFEVSVDDLEVMDICHTRHDPRELMTADEQEGTRSRQQANSLIAGDSPLGWILHTASHSHWASTE